jgi:general secretion pathway protein G
MRAIRSGTARGFTLVEVIFVLAIAGILIAIAVPIFERYVEKSRVVEATVDINSLQKSIRDYEISKGALPADLAGVGQGGKLDPWGRPYQYLNLRDPASAGKARKDKSLAPVNSDFDLYSLGKDGQTDPSLNNAASRDDVVRARDGRFVGLAEEFDP